MKLGRNTTVKAEQTASPKVHCGNTHFFRVVVQHMETAICREEHRQSSNAQEISMLPNSLHMWTRENMEICNVALHTESMRLMFRASYKTLPYPKKQS